MLRVGLTGGIACGKSVVAAMLRELGCHVLEADPLAHELMEPGAAAYAGVVAEFGTEILEPGGRIHRPRLAAIVFADAARRERLNAIVHPAVLRELQWRVAQLAERDACAVAVVVAALLVEAGYGPHLDRLAVAWCRPEQQLERLLARGLSEDEARQRLAAQMPIEEKCRYADDLIDCSGTLEYTRNQTECLAARWKQLAAG